MSAARDEAKFVEIMRTCYKILLPGAIRGRSNPRQGPAVYEFFNQDRLRHLRDILPTENDPRKQSEIQREIAMVEAALRLNKKQRGSAPGNW